MGKRNLKNKIKEFFLWIYEEVLIFITIIDLITKKNKVWLLNYWLFLKEVVLSKKQILNLFELLIRFTIYSVWILFVMDLISKYITAPILTGIFNFIFKILIFVSQLLYKAIYWVYIAFLIIFNIFYYLFELLQIIVTYSVIYFFKLLLLIYSFLKKIF